MKPSRQHDNHDSLAMMPWYPRDWRASTGRALMSTLARGIYRELLDAAWLDGGSLAADDRTLIALGGCTPREWTAAREEVLARFEVGEDGRLRQPRLTWQFERASDLRDRQRKAAETANEAKRNRATRPNGERNGDRSGDRHRVGHGERDGDRTQPSPEPSPEPEPEPKEKQIPAGKPAGAAKPRPDTWLTPYLAAWSERFPGSKPAGGKLAQFLAPLERIHEPAIVLDHWRRYLERTESRFVSPARFAETFPSWGPDAREPPTNGNGSGRGTVGQRSMDTAQRLLAEFAIEEGR